MPEPLVGLFIVFLPPFGRLRAPFLLSGKIPITKCTASNAALRFNDRIMALFAGGRYMATKLDSLRREYLRGGLHRANLPADPFTQFRTWFEQVVTAEVCDPSAMVLATVASNGQPSQRTVLLKELDATGFVFYSNTESRKGRELAANPQASLLFPWNVIERQVKVCGRVEPLGRDAAQHYFGSRPRESQLAALASPQSQVIASREDLLQRFEAVKSRYGEGDIPLPDNWGGYRLVPNEVEFWQGGAYRLHDCFRYQLAAAGDWQLDRIAP